MAKLCELCQKSKSCDDFQGVSICHNCKNICNTALNGDEFAAKRISVINYPGATPSAKENIIEFFKKKISEKEKNDLELIRIAREKHAEEVKLTKEREDAERRRKDDELKKQGLEGYYEFKILCFQDSETGEVDLNKMLTQLNKFGREGWQIKCSFSNELGHNSTSAGIAGFSAGTNATIDQSVFILERFVKFSD